MMYLKKICAFFSLLICTSFAYAHICPRTNPDLEGITIPVNIAPLHFRLTNVPRKSAAVFSAGNTSVRVRTRRNGLVAIGRKSWSKLTYKAAGSSIQVTVYVCEKGAWAEYMCFEIHVSEDKIDPVVVYRLVEPGYELWNHMGIFQRDLESFRERKIVHNDALEGACINCHSFCNRNPSRFLFHMRVKNGGTYVVNDGNIEKLNTKTEHTISALVYPSWHPSGRFVAFSVNDTKQSFHTTDPNRIEVFDRASDVVVYDMESHEIISCPSLSSEDKFETFPTFSPDGRTIYFCSAQSRDMPSGYDKVAYSLCSIEFDPVTRTFGNEVKNIYQDRNVSFPRVSPDGRFILMTISSYGNFSIWHKDADLVLLDLADNSVKPIECLNSCDVESYHCWSSTGRWVIFSSRRDDGLYTRPYIGHIDKNGVASKPFPLPQKDPAFYDSFMKSYNIPEFVSGPVTIGERQISRCAGREGTDITFRMIE